MGRAGRRSRRCAGLHLHRHLLVLGHRGRGLCPLVHVHGPRGLAHAQMGGAGRPAPRLALDRADRLPDGPLDRRAHPQPADHPHAGVHLLLPHDRPRDVARRRVDDARGRGRARVHQQHHHPLHGLDRRADRHAGGQYAGTSGQFGHGGLRAGAHPRTGLGFVESPPSGARRPEHPAALDDDDPRGLLLLRLDDHPRRGQPADELQQPNNPHALLAVLNRDQYGSRPLLYGPYFSAPPEALVEKEVTYLDEDGRYKTARIPRTTPTPRNSCTSSPACGTPTRTNGSTNSGAPTAPAPRSHATKTARRSATSRGVRCGRRCSTSAAGAPIRTPTATRAP